MIILFISTLITAITFIISAIIGNIASRMIDKHLNAKNYR